MDAAPRRVISAQIMPAVACSSLELAAPKTNVQDWSVLRPLTVHSKDQSASKHLTHDKLSELANLAINA